MPPPIESESAADQKPPPAKPFWRRDPVATATVVIAFATVVNVFVSAGLLIANFQSLRVAERVFAAANRPYVGVDDIEAVADPTAEKLQLTVMLKNFGTAPAERLRVDGQVTINGSARPTQKMPDKATTLFPGGEMAMMQGTISGPVWASVLEGSGTLGLLIRFSYEGPTGELYSYSQEAQYDPRTGDFINLGPGES